MSAKLTKFSGTVYNALLTHYTLLYYNHRHTNTYTIIREGKSLTVFDSSLPDSIILKQRGMISVVNKKLITSCSSVYHTPSLKLLLLPNWST